ncbi:hypothetical protein tinsulaeT_09580 [Thalassotalea insulae]|uniref:Flagellar hook-length control protein-like C-terminal domain-containing protein n=1 Tax=Thalassotalea insulae TaxID=2056778 RepID=A0ABQ6GNP3_9GAMM|nr:flagellar hook-length control protein FliK [Thalassotalea insulae]GLX77618.1 hypothetical protein tinsulaeT_09580 [Thalassotalea insulae]
MSQVSVLAIDVVQGVDSIGGNSNKAAGEQSSSADFSQVMSRQQQGKSGNTGDSNGKKSQDLESHVSSVPANASEQVSQDEAKQAGSVADDSDAASKQQTVQQGGKQTNSQDETEIAKDVSQLTEPLDAEGKAKVNDIAQQLLAFIQASDDVNTETTELIRGAGEKMPVSELAISLNNKGKVAFASESEKVTKVTSTANELSDNAEENTKQKESASSEIKKTSIEKNGSTAESVIKNNGEVISKEAAKQNSKSSNAGELEQLVKEGTAAQSTKVAKSISIQQTPPIIKQESENVEQLVRNKELLLSGADGESGIAEVEQKTASSQSANNKQTVNIQGEAVKVAVETPVKSNTDNTVSQESSDSEISAVVTAENNSERKTSASTTQRSTNQTIAANNVMAQQNSQQQTSSEQSSNQFLQQQSGKESNEQLIEQTLNVNKAQATSETSPAMPAKPSVINEPSASHLGQHATVMAEEHMFQHTMAKEHADSISVQSAKTAVQIHNETIAIYRKDFSSAVKDKVMVMINQKIKQLDIRLDPPELGSMQVRLNLQNEQAAVNFVVQNQQAKEAIEQNIHKLREMLSDSGVDVGDTNIEQRQQQGAEQSFAGQQTMEGDHGVEGELHDETMVRSQVNLYKASATGVDYYV